MMEILAACGLGVGIGFAVAGFIWGRDLARLKRQKTDLEKKLVVQIRENISLMCKLQNR